MYQPRTYRSYTQSDDLVSFRITVEETDLFCSCDKDLKKQAKESVFRWRSQLKDYIQEHPEFKESLAPLPDTESAPDIVKDMVDSANRLSVGPMAAVAGAFSEFVGRDLLKNSSQVIVENGGDIFLASGNVRLIGIYAGKSKFSERIALEVRSEDTPCGICTSSGTVGHSLSFGKADAVVVISPSTSLADAAATAICNKIETEKDIDKAISSAKQVEGIEGILIILKDTLGVWGKVKLVDI